MIEYMNERSGRQPIPGSVFLPYLTGQLGAQFRPSIGYRLQEDSKEKAKEEGREEGFKEGYEIEKAKQEGREQGVEEGKEAAKKEAEEKS